MVGCSIGGQVTQVNVNSRHRNITPENHETVNTYTYVLERVLKNVRSLTVKHAEIPSSFYNMEERDCTFKIGVTHESFLGSNVASNFHKYTVKIRPGYYNSDTLVAEVNAQMSLIPLDF